jgi:regulation of enolase protein 1 (concanavalin A-like superfamily)
MIEEGASKPAGAKPQLLAQLPPSSLANPGIIAGIIVFELLYGLVLIGVMKSIKRERIVNWGSEVVAEAPRPEPLFVPRVIASAAGSQEPTDRDRARDKGKEQEKAKEKKEPEKTVQVAQKDASKPSAVVAQNVPKKGAQGAARKKKGGARKKRQGQPKNAPTAEVALASPSPTAPEPPPPPPKEIATVPPLGPLIDPAHMSQVAADADGLTIKVPAGLFIFDGKRGIDNAPRALTAVEGDFTAEVLMAGDMRSGTKPLKGLPFTFQGAGLLLWLDKGNYVRLERTSWYTGERFSKIWVESCKDGKQVKTDARNIRDGAVRLRMERRGEDLVYSYSLDGKTWLKFPAAKLGLPPRVNVGISASNASPRPFPARFENFKLDAGGTSG